MTQEIAFKEGAIELDARVLARGLGLDLASLQEFVRAGKITNLCERGVDDDLGRYRLTFFYGNRRLRLVVGQALAVNDRLRRPPSARRNAQAWAVRVPDYAPGLVSRMLCEGNVPILSCK